jgi:hypothetical protein
VVGEGSSFEIRIFTLEGRVQRIIRCRLVPQSVTAAIVEEYKVTQLQGLVGSALTARRTVLDRLTFPQSLPSYGRVEIDGAHRIWVEEYQPPTSKDIERWWTVFAPDGRMLGSVRIPAGSGRKLVTIGVDRFVILRTDSDNLPHLEVYVFSGTPGRP